jgi:electron transfer flavoprotein beta subunit
MKVLIPVKRVIGYNAEARLKTDENGVELSNVKISTNSFCEIAVEEAVRLKEKGVADETVAVSMGPSQAQETLRTALAIGTDRAILLQSDTDLEPLAVADEEKPDLTIICKQVIDGDNSAVGHSTGLTFDAGRRYGDKLSPDCPHRAPSGCRV